MLRQKRRVRVAFPSRVRIALIERGQVLRVVVADGVDDLGELCRKRRIEQEGEAVAKWKRARLSSTQLSTYFVGVAEHLDLRDRVKARDGTAFNLKNYNNTVISFGSPPVKYVRELMGL